MAGENADEFGPAIPAVADNPGTLFCIIIHSDE
jgi:hypothetical protein